MTAELERYKTLCVSQEAEIARLKDELLVLSYEVKAAMIGKSQQADLFDKGWDAALTMVLRQINRITGE